MKRNKNKIEYFDREARKNGMRYAEAQAKKSIGMIKPIVIPKGYRKAGEWAKVRDRDEKIKECLKLWEET